MGGRRWVAGLALALWLTGCAAAKAVREGQDLEAAGRLPAAASKYLDALDRKPSHADALAALGAIAEKAWHQKLEQAEAAEAKVDYPEARDRYQELLRLEERLDSHGFLEFAHPVDAAAKVREMEEGAADRAYGLADKQRAAGQYEAAIAGYKEAQAYVPGFRDTQEKIAATFLEWGAAEATAGHWRDAWGRYVDAAAAGAPEGTTRAAEIAAALGRYHMGNGACRQAVRDLSDADRMAPGSVDGDLAFARSCAEVRVATVVEPLGRRDIAILGFDPAVRLQAGLIAALPDAASDYVVQVDESALDGPAKDAKGRLVVDRVLGARILAWDLAPFGPTERQARSRAEADVACTDATTGAAATCAQPFDLVWTEVSQGTVASISATSSLLAYESRKVLATKTFDVGARADARWAEGLRDGATGLPIDPLPPGWTAVRLPEDVRELVGAPRTLASDTVLFNRAADDLADEITDWAAEHLDAEPPFEDPAVLLVQPLPSGIQFHR